MSEQSTTATLVEPPPLGAGIYNYNKALKRELAQMSDDTRSTHFHLGRGVQQRSLASGRQEASDLIYRNESARVELYDEDDEAIGGRLYKLRVSIGAQAAKTYSRLGDYERQDLEWGVETGMVRAALRLRGVDEARGMDGTQRRSQLYRQDSKALMHSAPLLFEPIAQSSVQGVWLDRNGVKTWDFYERKRLILEGHDSTSTRQRQILLGGVAAFLSYLDTQNS